MDDSREITYDAERLKVLEHFGVALPRPLGEPPARTIARLYPAVVLLRLAGRRLPKDEENMCALARLPGDGKAADELAGAGLEGVEAFLEAEEAYRSQPLPERGFWSPIQSWAATLGGCELPEVTFAVYRSWVERCAALGRPRSETHQVLVVCAGCNRVLPGTGRWEGAAHPSAVSHGLCPSCATRLYGEFADGEGGGPPDPR